MVAHDDLQLECQLGDDVVHELEHSADRFAVCVSRRKAGTLFDFGRAVRLGGLVEHEEPWYGSANPTSNSLYQRLGYRPVNDSVVPSFGV